MHLCVWTEGPLVNNILERTKHVTWIHNSSLCVHWGPSAEAVEHQITNEANDTWIKAKLAAAHIYPQPDKVTLHAGMYVHAYACACACLGLVVYWCVHYVIWICVCVDVKYHVFIFD